MLHIDRVVFLGGGELGIVSLWFGNNQFFLNLYIYPPLLVTIYTTLNIDANVA